MCNPLVALPVWFDGKQLVMGDVGRLAEHASLFNCRVASPEQLGSQEGSAWQPRKLLCDYKLGCESVLPRRLKGDRCDGVVTFCSMVGCLVPSYGLFSLCYAS